MNINTSNKAVLFAVSAAVLVTANFVVQTSVALMAQTSGAQPIIVDDGDRGFASDSTWVPLPFGFFSTLQPTQGYQGDVSYMQTSNTQEQLRFAQWTFDNLKNTDTYDVYVTWPAVTGAARNATYIVGRQSTVVDQTQRPSETINGRQWELIARDVSANGSMAVHLSSQANGDYIFADAVMLVPSGDSAQQNGSVCGNGTVEEGEECDDGNQSSRDECSTDCKIQDFVSSAQPIIVDDGDRGFASDSTWVPYTGMPAQSYQGDVRYIQTSNTQEQLQFAQWSFNELTSDAYDVYVTWPAATGAAHNATYTIRQRSTTVNQTQRPSETINGHQWELIASNVPSNGTMIVYLSSQAHGNYVFADAVMLVPSDSSDEEVIFGCGNGKLDVGEECDDGNRSNQDECSNTCTRQYFRLHYAIVERGEVTIGYDNFFPTSFRLYSESNQMLQPPINFADLRGADQVSSRPLSDFPELIPGNEYKLCHGNAGASICSELVQFMQFGNYEEEEEEDYEYPPIIMDNEDAGFAPTRGWYRYSAMPATSHEGSIHYASSSAVGGATWNFSDIDNGYYDVFVNWPAYSGNSSEVEFTVESDESNTFFIDQTRSPNESIDDVNWQKIGNHLVMDNSLFVTIAPPRSGFAFADAVRIVQTRELSDNDDENDVTAATLDITFDSLEGGEVTGGQTDVPIARFIASAENEDVTLDKLHFINSLNESYPRYCNSIQELRFDIDVNNDGTVDSSLTQSENGLSFCSQLYFDFEEGGGVDIPVGTDVAITALATISPTPSVPGFIKLKIDTEGEFTELSGVVNASAADGTELNGVSVDGSGCDRDDAENLSAADCPISITGTSMPHWEFVNPECGEDCKLGKIRNLFADSNGVYSASSIRDGFSVIRNASDSGQYDVDADINGDNSINDADKEEAYETLSAILDDETAEMLGNYMSLDKNEDYVVDDDEMFHVFENYVEEYESRGSHDVSALEFIEHRMPVILDLLR